MTKKNSPASLQAKINQHFERLAKATDQAAASQAVKDYLTTCAKFHQYSPFNQFLILFERPDATHVAGYRKWLELHRYVKKGEKGIPIEQVLYN